MNDRIVQLRKHLGLTQRAFGKRIGLTDAMVSMIESGKKTMQNRTVSLICYTFGVNEDWLRNGSGDMLTSRADADEERQLLTMFGKLSDEMKLVVLKKVKDLLAADEAWTGPSSETGETTPAYAQADTPRPGGGRKRGRKRQ